jgi:cytochrome c oxidase subunit II
MNIILILIALLVLGIFLTIFRISNLASVMRGSAEKEVNSANSYNAVLLLVLPILGMAAAIWYTFKHIIYQPTASAHGEMYDNLFHVGHIVIILMFVITNTFLFGFAYKYRYNPNNKAHFYPDNIRLEIIWTIVPAIILTVLVFSGWRVWRNMMQDAPANAQVIEIMGKQFAWHVRYPGADNKLGVYNFRYTDNVNEMSMDFTDKNSVDDVQPSEIHLLKGRPVHLKIRARDVLHSVSLPQFRQKMDAVPGQPTKMQFTPIKTTLEMREELKKRPEWQTIDKESGKPRYETFNYEVVCQEVCGKGHFAMRYVLVVEDEIDYNKWLAKQEPFVKKNIPYVTEAIKKQQKMKQEAGVAMETVKPKTVAY